MAGRFMGTKMTPRWPQDKTRQGGPDRTGQTHICKTSQIFFGTCIYQSIYHVRVSYGIMSFFINYVVSRFGGVGGGPTKWDKECVPENKYKHYNLIARHVNAHTNIYIYIYVYFGKCACV